ncbi:hypothetical protein INR49_023350 [Caranx melampygus]|nr:hypothetical protein INR49_023350 [Caranx melampygus]
MQSAGDSGFASTLHSLFLAQKFGPRKFHPNARRLTLLFFFFPLTSNRLHHLQTAARCFSSPAEWGEGRGVLQLVGLRSSELQFPATGAKWKS